MTLTPRLHQICVMLPHAQPLFAKVQAGHMSQLQKMEWSELHTAFVAHVCARKLTWHTTSSLLEGPAKALPTKIHEHGSSGPGKSELSAINLRQGGERIRTVLAKHARLHTPQLAVLKHTNGAIAKLILDQAWTCLFQNPRSKTANCTST